MCPSWLYIVTIVRFWLNRCISKGLFKKDVSVSSYSGVSDGGLPFSTYGYIDVYTSGFTGESANGCKVYNCFYSTFGFTVYRCVCKWQYRYVPLWLYSVQLFLQHLWLYSVQVCLQVAIQMCLLLAIYCTIPSTCGYTGVPISGYTSVSTCGYTVPFLLLVVIQLFLQVAIQVYPLVAILYHSFHLKLYRCSYKWLCKCIHLWLYCTIPSTCSYTGVPTSGYKSVSTCGYTVPFLTLVAIQVFLQVDTSVSTCGSAPQLERVGGASLLSPTSGDIDNPSPPPPPFHHSSPWDQSPTVLCTSRELGGKSWTRGAWFP